MQTEINNKPLYKVLDEKRTKAEWEVLEGGAMPKLRIYAKDEVQKTHVLIGSGGGEQLILAFKYSLNTY